MNFVISHYLVMVGNQKQQWCPDCFRSLWNLLEEIAHIWTQIFQLLTLDFWVKHCPSICVSEVFFIILFKIILFLCMSVYLCVVMCILKRKASESVALTLQTGLNHPSGCWKPNLGVLQEQYSLITIQRSNQPLLYFLLAIKVL